MKVVFCLNSFLPQHTAGTEIYTYTLIRHLQSKGVDCLVLVPNFFSGNTDAYETGGVRVIKYAEPSSLDKKLAMGLRKPEGLLDFGRILRAENPDFVHFMEYSNSNGISLHHVLLAGKMGMKTLMTFHLAGYTCRTGSLMYMGAEPCDGIIDELRCSRCISRARGMQGPMLSLLSNLSSILFRTGINLSRLGNKLTTALGLPFLIRKFKDDFFTLSAHCERLIVISGWYREILVRNGVPKEKIIHIETGIDEPASGPLPKQVFPEKVLKVIYAGRITEIKGVHILIDAISRISPELITLDIYGQQSGTDYERECKGKSEGCGHIVWKGPVPAGSLVGYLPSYDLLCLPSVAAEMSPMVIREAFASGVPVLASDTPGNREIIRDGVNGWLFTSNNVRSLEKKLLDIINRPDMILSAKKGILPPRSFHAVAMEHLDLYKKLNSSS